MTEAIRLPSGMLDNGPIAHKTAAPRTRDPVLSAREREVLELLAGGATNGDVAGILFLSTETVKSHVRNAMLKLDARTRTHAVVLALQRGDIQVRPRPR